MRQAVITDCGLAWDGDSRRRDPIAAAPSCILSHRSNVLTAAVVDTGTVLTAAVLLVDIDFTFLENEI